MVTVKRRGAGGGRKHKKQEDRESGWATIRGWTTKISRASPWKKALLTGVGLFVLLVFFAIFTMDPRDIERSLKRK
jgi:hypothetical protein